MDFDETMNADLLKGANDSLRRALDDAAAGESVKALTMTGATAAVISAVAGFVVAALVIKLVR